MRLIEISAAERRAGALSEASLAAAMEAVDMAGFVGLVGAVSAETCDRLYDRQVAEYEWAQATFGPFPVRGGGDYEGDRYHGHGPQVAQPWLQADLVSNPFAIQVTAGLMAGNVHCANIGTNWALPPPPGSEPARQGVHGDAGPLFPGEGWTPPFILNLSVPLMDFTEENGATEVWPGTHRLPKQLSDMRSGEERRATLEARRAEVPPERMVAPKGTIVIRDPRAWHAGMPNLTDRPRIMVAMRHYIFWMRNTDGSKGDRINERVLPVEHGSESIFQHDSLAWRIRSVEAGSTDRLYDPVARAVPGLDRAEFDAAFREFAQVTA